MAKLAMLLYALLALLPFAGAPAAEGLVTLTPDAITAGHIEVAPLAGSTQAMMLAAFGRILDPAELTALSAQVTEARARIAAAEAKLSLARANADRAGQLFHAQHNVSVAEFQSAQSALQVAAADADVAKARLAALEAAIRADWGADLAPSIVSGSNWLRDPQASKACLVQAVLPLGEALAVPPKTATARLPGAGTLSLKLIGPSPRVPTGMTGQALFYVSTTVACPPIGMPLQIQLPDGPERPGVLVPSSAVVWKGAQPIVYQAAGQTSFLAVPISTAEHQGSGYFIPAAPDVPLKAGASVVVEGAGLLLSEAQAPADQTQAASGGDDD